MKAETDDSALVDQNDAGPRIDAAPSRGPLVYVERLLDWTALGLFVAMMGVALFQVISRFAHVSAVWTEELARVLFVASSLLAIAVCVRRREHIVVDYFLDRFSPRARQALLAGFDVLILLLLLVWLRGALRLFALNGSATYVTIPWLRVSHLFAVEIVAIGAMMLFVGSDLAARVRSGGRR
jgi:TRAP-type C4-dicarboxylate transport system permease small subunit